jgi:hypothetical protein
MEAGDTTAALIHGRWLVDTLWQRRGVDAWIEGFLPAFRELLRRRGYFVSSASDFTESLQELQVLGEGFDLYDLARQLAALDTILVRCLRVAPHPHFPDLGAFAPPCPCGAHPTASPKAD